MLDMLLLTLLMLNLLVSFIRSGMVRNGSSSIAKKSANLLMLEYKARRRLFITLKTLMSCTVE